MLNVVCQVSSLCSRDHLVSCNLSFTLQDYFKGRVTDVFFVPVSISYERILEEYLYAFELATGLPKPKESTSGLLKARKILDEKFGNIYVYFGQPFSLRQAAQGRVDRSVFSCRPLFEQFVSKEADQFVQELSLYAIGRIQVVSFQYRPRCGSL